jgi:hypothetical protein
MNVTCSHCGVRLEPEPGFYQGAMYVGYGFTVMAIILIGVLLYIMGDPSDWIYATTVVGFMLVIAPLNYRYSRILYLHFFGRIPFDSQYAR